MQYAVQILVQYVGQGPIIGFFRLGRTMVESKRNIGGNIRTGVVMDPISGIKSYKDSTFAMLLEAQRRGHELLYMETADLSIKDGVAMGHMRNLSVRDNSDDWFTLG
jgi:hypothetical protein